MTLKVVVQNYFNGIGYIYVIVTILVFLFKYVIVTILVFLFKYVIVTITKA